MIISPPYSVPLKCCSWWLNSPVKVEPIGKRISDNTNIDRYNQANVRIP